jgi:carboxyl-terminal processing protease
MSRRSSRPSAKGLLGLGAGAAIFFLSGCEHIPPPPPLPPQSASALSTRRARTNEQVYLQAWSLVRENYFDRSIVGEKWVLARNRHLDQAVSATNDQELYEGINALLAELHDSHTAALTPTQAHEQRTEKKVRAGFQLERIDDKWVVRDVLPKSPADEAGVKCGWIFVAEDGQAVGSTPRFHRVEGQVVEDDFLDDRDQPVHLTIKTRTLSTVPPPVQRTLAAGIVYLRFDEFNLSTLHWLSERLKEHRSAPAVIIDLRLNPGGEIFSLSTSIGEFFGHPVDIGTFIHRNGARDQDHSVELFSAHYPGKVVLLVGPLSASSSEIFSSALQHYGRATLIGRKTAGAVRGSMRYLLPDGGSVQISLMDFRALDGQPLEGNGIIPDLQVPTTIADIRAGRDPDLQAALLRLKPDGAAKTASPY